jgi:CHAT domain-containing protein/Flp pilus assembly protein TadD
MLLALAQVVPVCALAQNADETLAHARQTETEQGPQAALPEFEHALGLYRDQHDRHGEAITLGAIGNCHEGLGEYASAIDFLNRSLAMKRELGNRLEEGKTLSNLGLVYWDLGDYPKALEHFNRGLDIAHEIKDQKLEGTVLNNLGLVYDELGEYKRSLPQYQRALEIQRSVHFEEGESNTLGNIGGVYLLLGRYREALPYYEQSLEIDERSKRKQGASLDLGNIALCQLGLGEPEEAVRTFDRALALARAARLKKDEADWHKGKGSALMSQGKYDLAREEYRLALQSYEQAGLKRELVEALNDDGALHARLGDTGTARRDFRHAIELSRAIGHPRGVTSNLISLGDLEWRQQRYDQAAALFREAFERAQEAQDQGAMADSLILLATVLGDQGRIEEALPKAQQALEIGRSTGATLLEARALHVLGELARRGGRPKESLERYSAGEEIARRVGNTDLEWKIGYGKGRALEALGRDDEALAAYRQAVETIESVRNQLREERFQAGYIEDKSQVYVALVRLLLKTHKAGLAFHYAEKMRARSYLDQLDRNQVPAVNRAEVDLRGRIRQLQRAIEQETSKAGPDQKREKLEAFSSELDAAERDYQAVLDDLRSSRPGYAAVHRLAVPTAGEIQSHIDDHAALIEYIVGNDCLMIFVLTRSRVHARIVPVRASSLDSRVELFRDLVDNERTEDWAKPAESLRRDLIGPIEQNAWLKGVNYLYLIPHGALHYLPFAALLRPKSDGAHFLIQDYNLAYLPSAGALVQGPRKADPGQQLLALAPQISHLPFAQQEVRSVGDLFPGHSTILVDQSATKRTFKKRAEQFDFIHLATHGFFDQLNPMFSGVQLEPDSRDNGRMAVYEILRLHLKARLVTLSACETALGSGFYTEYPAGDDFVGLTRAFLYAGSSEVLATLWQVNDRSSSEFMVSFYRNLKQSGDAEALRNAQLALLGSGGRYKHPYFWAPFVLVGARK